jgi:hypothetical protein
MIIELEKDDVNVVGEYLRDAAYVGESGGYYNTEVLPEAREWDESERRTFFADQYAPDYLDEIGESSRGYSFELDGYRIDFGWFHDGDAVLCFRIYRDGVFIRGVENNDAKKNSNWRPLGPTVTAEQTPARLKRWIVFRGAGPDTLELAGAIGADEQDAVAIRGRWHAKSGDAFDIVSDAGRMRIRAFHDEKAGWSFAPGQIDADDDLPFWKVAVRKPIIGKRRLELVLTVAGDARIVKAD